MYALVSLWQLPEGDADGRLPGPAVHQATQAPGFVVGFWTYERANGKAFGFMLLDSIDHAQDLRIAMELDADAHGGKGAQLEMVRVQELILHAGTAPAEHPAAPHDIEGPENP